MSFELEGAPGLVVFTWGTPSIVSAYDHRGCIRPDLCSSGDRLTECGDLWTPATGVIGSTAWDDDPEFGHDQKADDAREIRRILEDA